MFKLRLRPISLRYLSDKATTVVSSSKPKLSNKPSNTPRPPKDPADEGYAPESVNHDGFEVPDYIRPEAYRQFSGPDECLGPGAGKNMEYKNAQYFGYHRFSFFELQNHAIELRDERRVSGGVQVMTEVDGEEEECPDDSLEAMKEREKECDKQLAAQAKDAENAQLQAWCDEIEKKQQEAAKLQMSNKSPDDQTDVCGDGKLNKAQLLQAMEKRKAEQEKIKKKIDEKVTEILADCATNLKTDKKDQSKVLAACKEKVKESTDKAVVPPAKGKDEAACKEAAKTAEKPKPEQSTGLKVKATDKKPDQCADPKKEAEKKPDNCEEPKKEAEKKPDNCEPPKDAKK